MNAFVMDMQANSSEDIKKKVINCISIGRWLEKNACKYLTVVQCNWD